MFNVVLVEPEIPPNTGNVIRLCANTGAPLHLIEPLGVPLHPTRLHTAAPHQPRHPPDPSPRASPAPPAGPPVAVQRCDSGGGGSGVCEGRTPNARFWEEYPGGSAIW